MFKIGDTIFAITKVDEIVEATVMVLDGDTIGVSTPRTPTASNLWNFSIKEDIGRFLFETKDEAEQGMVAWKQELNKKSEA